MYFIHWFTPPEEQYFGGKCIRSGVEIQVSMLKNVGVIGMSL